MSWADDPELVATFRAEVDERLASLLRRACCSSRRTRRRGSSSPASSATPTPSRARPACWGSTASSTSRTAPRTCSARSRTAGSRVRKDLVDLLLAAADGISPRRCPAPTPGRGRRPDGRRRRPRPGRRRRGPGRRPAARPRPTPRTATTPTSPAGRAGDSIRVPTRRVHDLLDVVGEAELDVPAASSSTGRDAGRASPPSSQRWADARCASRWPATADPTLLDAAARPGRRSATSSAAAGRELLGSRSRTPRAGWRASGTAPWDWRWCRCAGSSPRFPAARPRGRARPTRQGRRARARAARTSSSTRGCSTGRRRARAPRHQRRRPRLRDRRRTRVAPASRRGHRHGSRPGPPARTVVIEVADDGARRRRGRPARRRGRARAAARPTRPSAASRCCTLLFTAGFCTRDEVTETSGRGVGLDVVRTRRRGPRRHHRGAHRGAAPARRSRSRCPSRSASCAASSRGSATSATPLPVTGVVETLSLRDAPIHHVAGAPVDRPRTAPRAPGRPGRRRGRARRPRPAGRGRGPPRRRRRAAGLGRRRARGRAGARREGPRRLPRPAAHASPARRSTATAAWSCSSTSASSPCGSWPGRHRRGRPTTAAAAPPATAAATPSRPARRRPSDRARGRGLRRRARAAARDPRGRRLRRRDRRGRPGRRRAGCAATPVDLVLSDVEMPGMDGFTLTRTHPPTRGWEDVPVVIMTSRGDEADQRAGLDAGASAYLLKSEFDQAELIDTVRRLRRALTVHPPRDLRDPRPPDAHRADRRRQPHAAPHRVHGPRAGRPQRRPRRGRRGGRAGAPSAASPTCHPRRADAAALRLRRRSPDQGRLADRGHPGHPAHLAGRRLGPLLGRADRRRPLPHQGLRGARARRGGRRGPRPRRRGPRRPAAAAARTRSSWATTRCWRGSPSCWTASSSRPRSRPRSPRSPPTCTASRRPSPRVLGVLGRIVDYDLAAVLHARRPADLPHRGARVVPAAVQRVLRRHRRRGHAR